ARQEPVGAIAPGGAPAYNPLRDEIYVARRGVDIYDANTLDRLGSLTPDIEAQSCLGCTGQPAVSDVHVYSDRGLIWLEMSLIGAGRGGGVLPAPRLFALDTRQPLSLTLTALPTWDDRPLLWPPVRQRVYQNVYSARDVQHANLIVRNAQGTRIDWRDGLQLEWLSPAGELAYVPWGDRWLALDTVTWQPVGATTRFAVHSYLPDHDVLLAAQNATVLALAPDRGQPLPTEPAEAAVPTGAIQTLAISPEYGSDSTCFAVSDGTLYRSRDRGASWARLGAGLPRAKGLGGRQLAMALSPAFDVDRTLFVGGWEGEQGLGLWGSRDAGDTWEPLWRGLEHLRIEEIFFSPAYSSDRTVWALCRWHDVLAATSGRSLFRSTDAGETWALSAQTDEQSDEAAWPQIAPLVRERAAPWARAIKGGRAVEVGEGEKAHTTLSLPLGELIVEQRQAEDGVLYLLTSLSLYRSTDGGEHWELALGAAFEGRRATQSFTALATWGDGERQTLFLGDRVGQVQILEASELKWGAVS
ncbi:MAG: hypothetical protein JXA74_12270, partial [Anaerolineae bacterium]|nr:hypothetical protein [Anaerolineae bacterium]